MSIAIKDRAKLDNNFRARLVQGMFDMPEAYRVKLFLSKKPASQRRLLQLMSPTQRDTIQRDVDNFKLALLRYKHDEEIRLADIQKRAKRKRKIKARAWRRSPAYKSSLRRKAMLDYLKDKS